jgi:hypothetical protein
MKGQTCKEEKIVKECYRCAERSQSLTQINFPDGTKSGRMKEEIFINKTISQNEIQAKVIHHHLVADP